MSDAVRQRWPEMRVVHLPNYDRLESELPDTQIFVGYSIRPNQLPWARQLKWIHSTAAGVAQLTYSALRESRILVTNASGVHSIPIAEHVIGMMLSLSRKFPDAVRHQQNHRWAQQEIWDAKPRPGELHGAVLLLIGLGAVGRALRWRLEGLGMQVLAYDPYAEDATSSLENLLAGSDVVSMHAPVNPETAGMIGADQFAAMRDGVVFINTARAQLHDTDALVAALASGKVGAAGLDHFVGENLAIDHPLTGFANVVLTPHIGGATFNTEANHSLTVAEDLERLLNGGTPLHIVNPEVLSGDRASR